MLQLIRKIETISSCRDRDILAANIVAALREIFNARTASMARLLPGIGESRLEIVARADAQGLFVESRDNAEPAGELLSDYPLLQEVFQTGQPLYAASGDGFSCVFPMHGGNTSSLNSFLHVEMAHAPAEHEKESVERFICFYRNYINLLDYSELDTLTGLLNRKTFDEAFDRILGQTLASRAPLDNDANKRCAQTEESVHWLGVVDIDHFKRVNDTYGHLFGDEVLLRVSNLMRAHFRSTDRLFRFGGEEFVILLPPSTKSGAKQAFERFRAAVEQHEFPQIGQVTCSIGYTRITPITASTDIFGKADQALYFAKEHGRNQTCCYEELLEQGLVKTPEGTAPQPDFDIDALFL